MARFGTVANFKPGSRGCLLRHETRQGALSNGEREKSRVIGVAIRIVRIDVGPNAPHLAGCMMRRRIGGGQSIVKILLAGRLIAHWVNLTAVDIFSG